MSTRNDVDVATENSPELEFSIVYCGFAFTEEAAWQLARFPNVCLEALEILLAGNPDSFEQILAEMVEIAGPQAYEDMYVTSPHCLMMPFFVDEISERVSERESVSAVIVDFATRMMWTPEMITDDGRQKRVRPRPGRRQLNQ